MQMDVLLDTAEKVIKKLLLETDFTHPTGIRISLHTADPSDYGANEVTAGAYDYARQTPTLGTVAAKTVSNTADIDFVNMPAATVTHVGLFDSDGNFWWGAALTSSKTVTAGQTLTLEAGEVVFAA
jgi:hypothetical protein